MRIRQKINPHFGEYVRDFEHGTYLLIGGYGSSKSWHTALKVLLLAYRERRTILVVREVFDTIRDSCLSLLCDISAGLNLPSVVTRSPMQINLPNGSRIIFRGLDKPEKIKSIHDVSAIWIEEAAEIKYAAYKELLGRLRHPTLKLYTFLTLNPTAKNNWTYKHFFGQLDEEEFYRERVVKAGDLYLHHSTCDDNYFLPREYVARLEELKTYDADLYRVARLGRYGSNGVKVLPQFEVQSTADVLSKVNKIPRRYHYTGMDFGFETSYNAVIRCAVEDAEKILYIYSEWYRNHLTDDATADELLRLGYAGELIRCDSAEPKAIAYLKRRGLNAVKARKWSGGTRHARLDNTRKIKRFKRIICAGECVNAIRELRDLTYKVDRAGEIIPDEFTIDPHCLSALWYALDDYDLHDVKLSKGDLGL